MPTRNMVVQDPATAEHPIMPKAAIAAVRPGDMTSIHNPQSAMGSGSLHILPLEEIGPFIVGMALKS